MKTSILHQFFEQISKKHITSPKNEVIWVKFVYFYFYDHTLFSGQYLKTPLKIFLKFFQISFLDALSYHCEKFGEGEMNIAFKMTLTIFSIFRLRNFSVNNRFHSNSSNLKNCWWGWLNLKIYDI